MVKVAIMGHGTVGSGVYEVFEMNAEKIARTVGEPVEVKYVLDLRDFSSLPYGHKFVTDFSVIENDPEVTVVAEVMGGVGAAYQFTKRCLEAGKSVCTSNKELVATKGDELLKIAEEHGVNYMFEASVGGGIPIIRPMLQCLAANEFNQICGILNGTTNYILTQMIHNGVTFEDALRQAQVNGYAEKATMPAARSASCPISPTATSSIRTRSPAKALPRSPSRTLQTPTSSAASSSCSAARYAARTARPMPTSLHTSSTRRARSQPSRTYSTPSWSTAMRPARSCSTARVRASCPPPLPAWRM